MTRPSLSKSTTKEAGEKFPPDAERIDATTGLRATEACPEVVTEVFLAGSEPAACEVHGGVADQINLLVGPIPGRFRR